MTYTRHLYWYAGIFAACIALLPTAAAFADSNKNSSQNGAGVEVSIGANGSALVRGAKVTSVSSTTVNANTSLGSSVLSWVVKTNNDTDFSASKSGQDGLANIAIGDIISFKGVIDQSVSGLTVNAKQVKDWTHTNVQTKIEGVVTSISTTLNSFTIAKGSSTTTVQTNASTKFTEGKSNASFADLFLNAKVKISGLFNASSSVMTASNVNIEDSGDEWTSEDERRWREWVRALIWLKLW